MVGYCVCACAVVRDELGGGGGGGGARIHQTYILYDLGVIDSLG